MQAEIARCAAVERTITQYVVCRASWYSVYCALSVSVVQYVIVYYTLYSVHYTLWCELCVQCGPLTELDKGIVARDKGSFSIDTGVAGILTNKFTFL